MSNENCDPTVLTEKDDNITITPDSAVRTCEPEIKKLKEITESNFCQESATELNNVDPSEMETNEAIENGVTEEAKKDLLESIVDVLDDVIKDGMESDDLKEIERHVENAIQEMEKNDCPNIDGVMTNDGGELTDALHFNDLDDDVTGLANCDEESGHAFEQPSIEGETTPVLEPTSNLDAEQLSDVNQQDAPVQEKMEMTACNNLSPVQNNDETMVENNCEMDLNVDNCTTDGNVQQPKNRSPEDSPIDVNGMEETSNSISEVADETSSATSILEATLTMGKKRDSILEDMLNIPTDTPPHSEESRTSIPFDLADDEIDLLTPMVTVDEMPPNAIQEPIDSMLETNKNDAGVNKPYQINSNSIQKTGTVTSIQDLIVREFCLQQDSLCNLVSASMESTLNMDSVTEGNEDESLIQRLLLAESGLTSFMTIEDICKQAKILSSTEYLLLYAKIQIICFDIEPLTSIDIKRKLKVNLNKVNNERIQQIAKKCLSQESIEKVEKIAEVLKSLAPSECLFLHSTLPKVYKTIKDVLQKTTICCRPIVSQTVMWLKTHYAEAPTILLSKPDVFRNYNIFCAKNDIKPCGIADFGKVIKRTFTNIFHRRQVIRGKTQYFHCGLKPIYNLPTPKLPNLSDRTMGMKELYSCSKCCTIYAYMHNLKFRMKSVRVNIPGNEVPSKKFKTTNKENCKTKGGIVNGKPVLVNDPIELLSLSMNDSDSQKSLNDHTYVKGKGDLTLKSTSSYMVKKVAKKLAVKEYKNTKLLGKSRSSGRAVKVKYKQYQHPSIKNIMETYKDILLSHDLFKIHMNPVVCLENEKLHNWCAEKIKKFMDNLSDLSIVKINDPLKLKLKYRCCNTSTKVCQGFGEKLKDLKKDLGNIKITRDHADNYNITYFFLPSQLPLLSDTNEKNNVCSITKKLDANRGQTYDRLDRIKTEYFPTIRNKHQSIDNLFRKIDSLTLPEEVMNVNIDPMIVLNSQEVIDWYEVQLKNLKQQFDPESEDDELDNDTLMARESTAKMMNFCESDSCDSVEVMFNSDDQTLVNNLGNKTSNDDLQPEKVPSDTESSGSVPKKTFHLSDIINDSEKRVVADTAQNDSSSESQKSELSCFFCLREFKTSKELSNHREIHLRCRTCKRRLANEDAMRMHLIKHCFMNNALCAPNLILSRVDQQQPPTTVGFTLVPNTPSNVKKKVLRRKSVNSSPYPTSVLNFNNINRNLDQIVLPIVPTSALNDNQNGKVIPQLSVKSQKSANIIRFTRPLTGEVSHLQVMANHFKEVPDGQPLQQSTAQLKNTISNNFNRILLLSNNSVNQHETPNIVYGLYLNNRTDQSTPIYLNNYNRIGSDCAMNANPSCSSTESTNFMQIVETPNTILPQYDSTIMTENSVVPFEQHQDHSYYQQQPGFGINNNITTLNNISQENMHTNSLFDMPFLSTEARPCPELISTTAPKNESANLLPPTGGGAFRIRVKDIRELS